MPEHLITAIAALEQRVAYSIPFLAQALQFWVLFCFLAVNNPHSTQPIDSYVRTAFREIQ